MSKNLNAVVIPSRTYVAYRFANEPLREYYYCPEEGAFAKDHNVDSLPHKPEQIKEWADVNGWKNFVIVYWNPGNGYENYHLVFQVW